MRIYVSQQDINNALASKGFAFQYCPIAQALKRRGYNPKVFTQTVILDNDGYEQRYEIQRVGRQLIYKYDRKFKVYPTHVTLTPVRPKALRSKN